MDPRFAGVDLPRPEFANDAGSADPALAQALEQWSRGEISRHPVISALMGTRVMVPLVAVLDEEEIGADGLRRDKSSHMATVTMVLPDGRRGLLAFSSVAALGQWDPQARGIPAPIDRAAQAAIDEGADALVLDIAGPVLFPITGPAMQALADGHAWFAPQDHPEVLSAIERAAAAIPSILSHEVDSGLEQGVDIVVIVEIAGLMHPDVVARKLARLLDSDPIVSAHCPAGIAIGVQVDDSST
ncbi:MAG: SseB family protein [Actinomycetes bacterium]